MRHFPFLLFITLISCQKAEENNVGIQLKADESPLMPRTQYIDSVNHHPYEIPFWNYDWEQLRFDYQEPGLTKLRFSNFTFKIAGEMWRMEDKDTLTISEDVGYYLEGRNMWIEGQDPTDRFELYMSVEQRIEEQYDYRIHDQPNFDWEKWEKERVKMNIRSEYYKVRDSAGIYRLPWVHTGDAFFEQRLKQNHDFTDTTRHIEGEMGGSNASFFIDNKFCVYWVDFAMFKIVKTAADGTESNHFFKMWYSYGC